MKVRSNRLELILALVVLLAISACGGQPTEDLDEIPPVGDLAAPVISAISPVGPANNNNPVVSGTSFANAQVFVFSNSSCSSLVGSGVADGSGAFAVAASVADNSSVSLFAAVSDGAVSSPCSTTYASYVEDSAAAAPILSGTTPGSPSSVNTPSVSGITEPNATVSLFSNASCSTLLGSGVANGSGSFAISLTVSSDTSLSIYGRIVDSAGNTSACTSSALNYIEDSTPPAAPTLTGTSPVSPSNNNNPSVGGSTEAGAGVAVYSDSSCLTLVGTGTANGSGNFVIPVTVASDATSNFYAKASDLAGNISGCSVSTIAYVEDSTPPASPSFVGTTPASPANQNSPAVSGTTEASAAVTFYSDSGCTTSIGSGAADISGNFSATASVADNSTTSIYGKSTDVAGNTSACSASSISYVEDSLAPSAPTLSTSTPISPSTNSAPLIGGTAESGSLVTLYSDASCTASLSSGTANGLGNFGISIAVAENSTTTVYGRASDSAGNLSACSSTFVNYVEDSFATTPVLSSTSPVSPSNNNSPSVMGSAEVGATVSLYSDSSCSTLLGSGATDGVGSFSIAVSLASDATTNIYARAVDGLGNISACTSSFLTYVEDSTPPAAPNLVSSSPLGPANNNSPTVNGTAEAGATIHLFSESSCTTQIGTGSATFGGTFAVAATVANDSVTSIYGRAIDAANNSSSCSLTSVSYVEDSTPPAAPTVTNTTPATRANTQAVSVEGTAEANSSLVIYSDAGCTTTVASSSTSGGGTFSVGITPPWNTVVSYYAKATDAAGNGSACSATSASYEAYTIPAGMAVLQGTQTNAPTTPTNLNQSTAYSMQWSSSDIDMNYYQHSTTTNSHQLKVLVAGDYLVSFNLPVTGTVTNGSVRSVIRVNGVAVNGSQAQSSYMAIGAAGHNQSSNQVAILVPSLVVNDIIDVTVETGGIAGTITILEKATVTAEFVSSARTIFTASATQTTNSTNLNQTTAYPLKWTSGIKDSGFTHDNVINPGNITLDAIGTYVVHVNIPVTGSSTNVNAKLVLKLNGTAVSGGQASQGLVYAASARSSVAWSGIVTTISTNSILTLETIQEARGGAATATVVSGMQAALLVERLASTSNLLSVSGTSLVSGTDFNSTTSPIQWTNSNVVDTGVYSHSTSTNPHQITVLTSGDYIVLFNSTITSAVLNANSQMKVLVNGVPVLGGRTDSFFLKNANGHNESSGVMLYHLRRLNANDVITFTSEQEAAAGIATSPATVVTLIHKPNP